MRCRIVFDRITCHFEIVQQPITLGLGITFDARGCSRGNNNELRDGILCTKTRF